MAGVGRRFLIAALVCLLLGLAIQALHMADQWLGFSPPAHTVTSIVLQLLVVGWLTQAGNAQAKHMPIINENAGRNRNRALLAEQAVDRPVGARADLPSGSRAARLPAACDRLLHLGGGNGTRTALSHRGAHTAPH
jgi:hypothetical protein